MLWPDAYEVATLDDQLDRAVRKLVSTPEHFFVGPGVVRMNKVLDWFKDDFGGEQGLRTFFAPYLGTADAEGARVIGHSDRVLRVRLDPERPGVVTGSVCTVIIPTLNEASSLPNLLDDLAACPRVERVIVSDGGSVDATCDIALSRGVTVVSGRAGRGEQLRRGASAALSPWYVFLHADSRLDEDARSDLDRFLDGATATEFAHFGLVFDTPEPVFRFIEFGQRLRERLFGMPYGDQGLVVSRALYDRVGGFPDWPIMEDVGIIDRLSGNGRRLALGATLTTSGRRYRREGPIRALLRNLTLIVAFRLGADPETLARRYGSEHSETLPGVYSPDAREVIVFARAPVPGRVKTRLAADVGPERATRIYRQLGRGTVDALRDGPLGGNRARRASRRRLDRIGPKLARTRRRVPGADEGRSRYPA